MTGGGLIGVGQPRQRGPAAANRDAAVPRGAGTACYCRDVRFEWDPNKAAANMRRHGVSFEEASTVFGDPLARTFADPDQADSAEERELTFGTSAAGRALVVAHCERKGKIRLISAREMTRYEKREYEEGNA